jgi:hypothetical protein
MGHPKQTTQSIGNILAFVTLILLCIVMYLMGSDAQISPIAPGRNPMKQHGRFGKYGNC